MRFISLLVFVCGGVVWFLGTVKGKAFKVNYWWAYDFEWFFKSCVNSSFTYSVPV